MRERETIALSGLLHDIGKLLQRAGRGNLLPFSDDRRREYVYEHAHLTAAFLDLLKDKGIIDEVLRGKLDRWGARHHNPTDELESVVIQIADWYSSAEREVDLGSCVNLLHSVFERVSLQPPPLRRKDFEERRKWLFRKELNCTAVVTDIPEEYIRTFGYYRLSPLRTGEEIFPTTFRGTVLIGERRGREELLIVPTRAEDLEKARQEERRYSDLYEGFKEEILGAGTLQGEQLLNYIYYLLYKYTWCVPASTWDSEKASRHYPDISLFDHSRVLSAIAVSLYSWAKERNLGARDIKPGDGRLLTDDEEVFLLVEGDIGGIQSFIYSVHRASESELSIAKALRGRSFFLTMLPEVTARYILRELDYPITSALFIGGGKFQLLIGNTDENRRRLREIEHKINEWMFREFHGELNLSMVWIPVKGSALRNRGQEGVETYLDHVEKLQLELDRKKKRKLGELVYEEFENDFTGAGEICPSCRSMKTVEGKPLCRWCQRSQDWGSVLPKVKYIAFSWEDEGLGPGDPRKTMEFGGFGKVYLLEDGDLGRVRHLPEILNMDTTELKVSQEAVVNGFRFTGHSAPRVSRDSADLLNELWRSKGELEEELDPGDILPFELLAEFAEGDKKLGFFRADVDYLGLILSDGLRFDEKGEREIYTISRIATLSRMLDLFFTGYLNRLAEEISSEHVNERLRRLREEGGGADEEEPELLEKVNRNGRLSLGSLIYTVYSGGDDLFVIAPHDLAVRFAGRLRERFREFTCGNRDFGISGGIFVGRHNTPVHLVAKFAEDLEKTAKDLRREKDAVAIFGGAFPWDEESLAEKGISSCEEKKKENGGKRRPMTFAEITELAERMAEYLREGKFSRAFLYRLLYLHRQHCSNGRVDLRIYPKIYYQLGRNVKEDVREDLTEALLNGMEGRVRPGEVIRNLNVILSLALMKTRRGGG